jgi:hypothetical protein
VVIKAKGLNRIAIIGYGHHQFMREEKLGFVNSCPTTFKIL